MTQIQDATSKFSQGAHALSTTEVQFLRAVRSIDCTNQFYDQAFDWANGLAQNFDLFGNCSPTLVSDRQVTKRALFMTTIALYADQIAALATSDDNKALGTNGQQLASHINNIAKQGGLQDLSIAAGVESAIIGLTQLVLDWQKARDISEAAKDQQPNLQVLVSALKDENIALAAGIESKYGAIETKLRQVVSSSPQNTTDRFRNVLAGREILQKSNPFGTVPVATSVGGLDQSLLPENQVGQINGVLDSLLEANRAIALAGTGGIVAAVNDLIARAQAARGIDEALQK